MTVPAVLPRAAARGPTLGWLRVALALMVLNLHYGFFRTLVQPWIESRFGPLAWVNDGAIAVFGFFSLSGYLVADMLQSGRYPLNGYADFWRFVAARWARIYPLYWLVLALWIATRGWPGWLETIANVLLWPYGLWSFGYDQRHFGPLFNHLLLVPAWTLALDLVLYPIGALLGRHDGKWLAIWMALALLWWAAAAWLAPPQLGKAAYDWWHFRYWTGAGSGVLAFTMGMALRRWGERFPRPFWSALPAAGIVLWCAYFPIGLGYFSSSLLATAALAWLVHVLAARGRSQREADLGNFTYALYLIHIPVLYWLEVWLRGIALFLLSTLLSLSLALFLAMTVEAPLEKIRRRLAIRPKLFPQQGVQTRWGQSLTVWMTAGMLAATCAYIVMVVRWANLISSHAQ